MVRPAACDWRATWPRIVGRARPDGVLLFFSHWDALDRRVDGRWLRVGTSQWASATGQLFEQAFTVLTAHGARVVVGTMPYVIGVPGWRTDAYNELLARVAARHAGAVTVLDLKDELSRPDVARWDGVHLTVAGSDVVAARVLPELAARFPLLGGREQGR
jgi:lysophospholipase L1-like esterase